MNTELARTIRAAVMAGLLAFVMIAGIAWFLGIPTSTSIISGLVAAVLSLALVLGAARRSGHLEADPTTTTPTEDDRG